MKTTTILAIIAMLSATPAYATEAACADTVNVKVSGLVCDFCARSLEKLFGKQKEVSSITVDLDKGQVLLHMNAGQSMDEAKITELITDSGYNVTNIVKGC